MAFKWHREPTSRAYSVCLTDGSCSARACDRYGGRKLIMMAFQCDIVLLVASVSNCYKAAITYDHTPSKQEVC